MTSGHLNADISRTKNFTLPVFYMLYPRPWAFFWVKGQVKVTPTLGQGLGQSMDKKAIHRQPAGSKEINARNEFFRRFAFQQHQDNSDWSRG